MPQPSHLTTGEVAAIYAAPEWQIRKIVDSLSANGAEIPRAGLYRLIPRTMLPAIGQELQARAAGRRASP